MRLVDVNEVSKYVIIGNGDLRKVPTVEAIPKADYEARLKADMMAMLEDLDMLIYKFDTSGCGFGGYSFAENIKKIDVHGLIQQKIRELEENQ